MDLQSGKLYWPTTLIETPQYPALQEDLVCDVLIIGGGSSGAQCAVQLTEQGVSTVVVDKRSIGEGSTSSNTALIQYAGNKSFQGLVNTFGEDAAARHMKLCEEAITQMENLCRTLPIDPEFIRRDSLYYASYEKDVLELQQEYELLTKYGFDVDLLTQQQIAERYPFTKAAALYYYNDAEMNPYKFTYGLLEKARSLGAQIYEHTEITRQQFGADHNLFYTKDNHTIKAKHAIFAAGYEDLQIHNDKNALLTSSYAVITQPVIDFSSWHKRTLIWETARPYIYMRTTADNRVIIGGLDKDTTYAATRDTKILHSKEKLLEEFNKLFPDIQVQADYYLGAFYGSTHDGLPIIGSYENYPNCYFLMGYGDNGTVYSMVLANIISGLITKGQHPDAALYLQDRPLND